MPGDYVTSSGYTCSRCGIWINHGWAHQCIPQAYLMPPWWSIDMSLQRIAAALESIAATLEQTDDEL